MLLWTLLLGQWKGSSARLEFDLWVPSITGVTGWTHLASASVSSLVSPVSAQRDEDKINIVYDPSCASFIL